VFSHVLEVVHQEEHAPVLVDGDEVVAGSVLAEGVEVTADDPGVLGKTIFLTKGGGWNEVEALPGAFESRTSLGDT
jgi:hypothetical protein